MANELLTDSTVTMVQSCIVNIRPTFLRYVTAKWRVVMATFTLNDVTRCHVCCRIIAIASIVSIFRA